jgi:hypothetical protein
MPVLRHISLDDEHIEKMKPYLENNGGNLCASFKEILGQAGKYSSRMNSSAIDTVLLNWLLKEVEDILIPDKVLDEILDPVLITSMEKFEKFVKQRIEELEWDIDIVFKYDSVTFPSEILIEMRGGPLKTKFMARILSQYLVKNSMENAPLEIKFVVNINSCMKLGFSRSNKKDSLMSLNTFFGNLNETTGVIKTNPDFWKNVIHRHIASNYNMVTVHRNYLEDIFADKIPHGEIMIETMAKRPVQDIPLKELLPLIKEVYEAARVVDRVNIENETIIVSHYFRNKNAVERLKNGLVMLRNTPQNFFYFFCVCCVILRPQPTVQV